MFYRREFRISSLFLALISVILTAIQSGPALAQTVFFERTVTSPSTQGFLSSLPTAGPASSISNLYSALGNTASAGVTIGSDGLVYFSDVSNNQILRINSSGNVEIVVPASTGLSSPRALTYDTTNDFIYIMDRSSVPHRILRAHLGSGVPVTSFEVFASNNSFTGNLGDMKFNSADGNIYWTNSASLFRAPSSSTIPITAPEALMTSVAASVDGFDFYAGSPQLIYFIDTSTLTKGIYSAPVTKTGNTTLTDTQILDLSSNPNFSLTGIAIDSSGTTMCVGGYIMGNGSILCGNRSTPGGLTSILTDDGSFSTLQEGPTFLVIQGAPPDTVVHPDTTPTQPQVAVNAAQRSVTVTLQSFSGADLNTSSALSRSLALSTAKKKKRGPAKIGFKYEVELQRTADENGNPVTSNGKGDFQKKVSKRNELTFKNLSAGSTYSVAYRVQITSKKRGKPLKIIKRTPTSPSNTFVLQ